MNTPGLFSFGPEKIKDDTGNLSSSAAVRNSENRGRGIEGRGENVTVKVVKKGARMQDTRPSRYVQAPLKAILCNLGSCTICRSARSLVKCFLREDKCCRSDSVNPNPDALNWRDKYSSRGMSERRDVRYFMGRQVWDGIPSRVRVTSPVIEASKGRPGEKTSPTPTRSRWRRRGAVNVSGS